MLRFFVSFPGDVVVDAETLEGTLKANLEIDALLEGATSADERDPNPVVIHGRAGPFPVRARHRGYLHGY